MDLKEAYRKETEERFLRFDFLPDALETLRNQEYIKYFHSWI